ncbi:MAG: mechanosensitive ion channel [Pseudomonadota bacterium]
MEQLWSNITAQVTAYGPRVLWALIILVAAYVIGKIVQWAVSKGVKKTGFDNLGPHGESLGNSLGSAAFWVILLIGVIQALTRLELTQVAEPLNQMINQIMFYMPKIFAAVVLFVVFALVARIVRQTAKAVFVFADPVPEQLGLASGPVNASGIIATVLSTIIYIIGGITALGALQVPAITEPLTGVLSDILDVIPNVILASLLLAGFIFIARIVSGLVDKTLPQTGLDTAISEMGLLEGADKGLTASRIVSIGVSFFITLLGLIQALRVLNFEVLTNAMNVVLDMGASIAFGAFIIFAGVFLARLISNAMASAGGKSADTAAAIVKWVIIGLALIMGISRMGLDPTGGDFILNIAQVLSVGVAVGVAGAVAIGFGWGGRDWFAKQLEAWKPTK